MSANPSPTIQASTAAWDHHSTANREQILFIFGIIIRNLVFMMQNLIVH